MIDVIDSGAVRELRLNRPPVNALSPELLASLRDAVIAAPEEGAAAVVLSGGDGIFTAGLDVPVLLALDRDGMADALEVFFDAMEALAVSPVPVAAAITGHSPAGGAVLALFCDWRVMAAGEFGIGLNEVQVGIPMPRTVSGLAARAVGARRGEELCVTGRLLSPPEALAMGLVDEVVAPAKVVEAAYAWCEGVISAPRRTLELSRAVARRDLVELVENNRVEDTRVLHEEWFRPEAQGPLRELIARLKGG